MRKRDNFAEINEMRKMLSEVKSLTLENFIMPEEDSFEEETPQEDDVLLQQKMDNDVTDIEADNEEEVLHTNPNDMSSIEKELTQIRKIALSVINRLADQPTSPQYDTMKKIWNMVDKAIEQPQKGNGNFSD